MIPMEELYERWREEGCLRANYDTTQSGKSPDFCIGAVCALHGYPYGIGVSV